MFEFINSGNVIATADSPRWLEYLYQLYPHGNIVEVAQNPSAVVPVT